MYESGRSLLAVSSDGLISNGTGKSTDMARPPTTGCEEAVSVGVDVPDVLEGLATDEVLLAVGVALTSDADGVALGVDVALGELVLFFTICELGFGVGLGVALAFGFELARGFALAVGFALAEGFALGVGFVLAVDVALGIADAVVGVVGVGVARAVGVEVALDVGDAPARIESRLCAFSSVVAVLVVLWVLLVIWVLVA
jgi:hypothetical protein